MNQPIPPTPPKKSKKLPVWLIIVGVVIALLVVQYIVQGPAHGDKQVARIVEQLKEDSIQLNKSFSPRGDYAYQDIDREVSKIYDLGRPERFHSHDSAFIFSNPKTAPLATYNKEKCKEVLAEVLPQWRRTMAFAMDDYNGQTPVICKISGDDSTELGIYSLKYSNEKSIKSDYAKLAYVFKRLGFREVTYGSSPVTPILIFDIK